MPELTPEMAREIDEYIDGYDPAGKSPVDVLLAAQRAEITRLKEYSAALEEASAVQDVLSVRAQRDALVLVARAAQDLRSLRHVVPGEIPLPWEDELEKALAAHEVQALLAVAPTLARPTESS